MHQAATQSLDLLSIADVETKTGISRRTLWRWISSGRFPQPDLAVGRIRRWKHETVEEWIESHSRSAR